MSAPAPSWYDVLDVDRDATPEQVRAAWKAAIADLDPTDRRFRVRNQAAEVLLDPERRAAYDAELAAAEAEATADEHTEDEPLAAPPGPPPPPATEPDADADTDAETDAGVTAGAASRERWVPPTWLLVALAVLTAVVAGIAGYLATVPSDTEIEESTREAQSAAERAVVPVLSYDYRSLDETAEKARAFLTSGYRDDYDDLFELIRDNAPGTQTVVDVQVVRSGIVRSGEDRVQVLLFVNRPTTNKANREPVVYKDQVTVTMENVDGEWLVDDLLTSPPAK